MFVYIKEGCDLLEKSSSARQLSPIAERERLRERVRERERERDRGREGEIEEEG